MEQSSHTSPFSIPLPFHLKAESFESQPPQLKQGDRKKQNSFKMKCLLPCHQNLDEPSLSLWRLSSGHHQFLEKKLIKKFSSESF
jgi:hypothetical protein